MNEGELINEIMKLVTKTIDAEVAVKEEQLAEMQDIAKRYRGALGAYRQGLKFKDESRIDNLDEELEQALSAAPKRRRMVWEGEAYVDAFGRVRFLDPQSRELSIQLTYDKELTGEMFFPDLAAGKGTILGLAGHRLTVTMWETDPPTGPIDCPMCGVAGGNELGPCPECKGAGFVEAE